MPELPTPRRPAERRPRGRPKLATAAQQQAKIVDATRRLFLAQGYGGTTMNEVAAHCRVSKRTLYELFPSKADLLGAIIERHRTSMLALPGDYAGLSLSISLERIFQIDISEEDDEARAAFLNLTIVEAARYPEVGEMLHRLGGQRAHALLAEWMETERQAGRLFIDDTPSAARILMDMMFGAIVTKTGAHAEWPGLDARKDYMRRCIRIFVHGTGNRPASET
ncbi:TetR/AcrR family transcriptional regulator [Shinella curvata]|uniref:TetR/AcrR family transcriptional regulator n=1 Tax=Shinella curvata TaxID=1817964 RepID=A0ABT8XJ11_9HYPH|nr:TetR/AcrR family transcriptional regulator [Shinella curvata]MCJ8055961.1 TetR/AcrR family transcriptional regulator [Shinella curvata]MDO6123438.1 TetR/AcrR family transcriptional regulator [Shinella curvata]